MLQSGNLQIHNSSLNPGNLSAQSGTLSNGGRGLTGPTTYISVENDPIFSASPAATITQEDIDRWNEEVDLSGLVSYEYLSAQSYVTNQALNNYVTYQYLTSCSYATNEYVTETVNNAIEGLDIHIDLSSYVSKNELSAQSYITQTQLSANGYISSIPSEYITEDELGTILLTYATKNYVDNAILNAEIGGGDVTIDLDEYLRKDELPSYLLGYITKNELSAQSYVTQQALSNMGYLTQHQDLSDYATKAYVVNYVATYGGGSSQDLTNYVTKTELSNCGYLTSVPAGYATENYVDRAIAGIEPVSYETTYETVTYTTQNISIWQGTLAQYNALPDHITYQLYLIAAE